MNATAKPLRNAKVPALPRPERNWKRMTGAEIERMLRRDGFRPTDAETKRRLQAAGHWGMPEE